jgi:two-component sensor histidine kinase
LRDTQRQTFGGVAIDLHRDAAEVARARRVTSEFLTDSPGEAVTIAQLLASELVSNAVEHGSGRIRLSLDCRDAILVVRVADDSPRRPRFSRLPLSAERGRGLLLVERLAMAWGVTPAAEGLGKTVWFKLRTG